MAYRDEWDRRFWKVTRDDIIAELRADGYSERFLGWLDGFMRGEGDELVRPPVDPTRPLLREQRVLPAVSTVALPGPGGRVMSDDPRRNAAADYVDDDRSSKGFPGGGWQ